MPYRSGPISGLDLLLARPLVAALCEAAEPRALIAEPLPDAAVSPYRPRRRACRRLQRAWAARSRDANVHGHASGAAPSDDESIAVLMFSLAGLALSLELMAKICATGAGHLLAACLRLD